MYKFGTRYYDPQTGRGTQKDPVGGSVGKIGSSNPYVYAGNEPTMQVDPSGRDSCFEAIKNAALGVIVADLTAIGAFIGYVYSVAQVDAAAAGLAAALEGAGDVTAASAAVGAATLGQAFAVFVLIGAAVIIFQIFSQNADAIQAACS